MEAATKPEELINSYVKLRTATRNIANGLGFLALLWSTVVLRFVTVLRVMEFWVLIGMSFLLASRMLDFVDEDLYGEHILGEGLTRRLIYVEEARMAGILGRLRRIRGARYCSCFRITLIVLLVTKVILFLFPVMAIQFVPFVSLGLSVWRLVRRDYGNAGGDIANIAKLRAALDIFYALVLFLSLFVIYWMFLFSSADQSVDTVASLMKKQWGYEKWSSKLVLMYYKETTRKFKKDGELPDKWNLIKYGAGLLQSASGDDDHLWGARVLDKFFDKDASVRQELLSSRSSIQNLIGMIGRRGTADNIENSERASRILAHLASDLHITHFPGTLQCICSLLESCNKFCEPQLTCPSSEKNPDEQSRSLEQVNGSSSARLAQRKRTTFLERLKEVRNDRQQHEKDINEWMRFTYRSRGSKELISQGLLILERLTQDEENCTEIRKHQRLLSKIISPLRSQGFPSNVRNKTMVEILSRSLKVVSRLLTISPGDGTTRIQQELASNTEAVSNLMGILENGSEVTQKLHEQSLEILTELAFDYSFAKQAFGGSACMLNKLFNNLLRIFLEEDSHTIAAESDREKATRLRGKAGEALARLLSVRMARDANVTDIFSRQEAIHLLTKVFNQILSSKMGTAADAVKRSIAEMEKLVTVVFNKKMGKNERAKAVTKTENLVIEEVINQILCSNKMKTTTDTVKRAFTRNENLPTEVLDELLSSKKETTVVDILRPLIQGIEKQSEERKFMAAMLSIALVTYNENVISKEEFARAIPEDASLVKNLVEILKLNKHSTAECLRIVKLTCQVVITMVQVKPSCIQHFNEHNFKEAMTEVLETMSEVDDCMLFAGNDRELIKPVTSLASLVKEAQKLLNTA
ncbi:unnamed protein product [Urochloa humidicola]